MQPARFTSVASGPGTRKYLLRSWVRYVAGQLRQGKNLDAYVPIVASIVFAVLDLVGAVSVDKVLGQLLAVLALLAIGTLVTRAKLEAVKGRPTSPLLFAFRSMPSTSSQSVGTGQPFRVGMMCWP